MGILILSSHHVKYASAAISTQSHSDYDTSYIVTFGDSTSYRDFVLDNHNMVIEKLPNLNMVLASIPDESDVDMLRQLNGVKHVEKGRKYISKNEFSSSSRVYLLHVLSPFLLDTFQLSFDALHNTRCS